MFAFGNMWQSTNVYFLMFVYKLQETVSHHSWSLETHYIYIMLLKLLLFNYIKFMFSLYMINSADI